MKISSVHFILRGESDYKDLAPIFSEILRIFLENIDQMPEDDDIFHMFIELNIVDLKMNRKPEGYNRKGKARLVFPMDRKEFYIKTYGKGVDLSKITDDINYILTKAGINFDIKQNDCIDFD